MLLRVLMECDFFYSVFTFLLCQNDLPGSSISSPLVPSGGFCPGPVPPMDGGPSSSGRDRRGGDDRTRRRSRGGDDEREQSDRRTPSPSSAADAALNFLSLSVDPALALATPGLLPPDPRAPVLDNVTACRRLLPPGAEGAFPDAERLFSRGGGAAAGLGALEKKKPPRPLTTAAAAAARQSHHRKRVPALDAIAEASTGRGNDGKEGPLALLKRAYDSESRVRVLTRHSRGVRGSAVGTLAGFDVFFNLILRDVVEEYRVRVPVTRERPPKKKKAEGEGGEEAAGEGAAGGGGGGGGGGDETKEAPPPPRRRLRHGFRLEARTRSLRLVFLRGDSVVLVSSGSCA